MLQPWDKRPNERNSSYQKFQEYLSLGPRRTATELAQRLGLSQQAISKLAKTYDWHARARAYDIAHGHVEEHAPPPPPPPRNPPRKPPPPPPPPPPIEPEQPVEPEIVAAILASEEAQEEVAAMASYRSSFEPIGRMQLGQAQRAADVIDVAHGMIMQIIPLWIKALEYTGSEESDIRTAALQRCDFYSKQTQAASNLYWRSVEAEVKLAGGDARTILGDCAGVHRILEEVFAQQANK